MIGGMGRSNREEIPLEKLEKAREIFAAMHAATADAVDACKAAKTDSIRIDGWFTLGQALDQTLAAVRKIAGPASRVHTLDAMDIYEPQHKARLAARKKNRATDGQKLNAAENQARYNRKKKQ